MVLTGAWGRKVSMKALWLLIMLGAAAQLAGGQSFVVIDPPPAPWNLTRVMGLSTDGRAAAGYSHYETGSPPLAGPGFHWSLAGGRVDFGLQPGVPAFTESSAISGNGLVVGGSSFADISTPRHA